MIVKILDASSEDFDGVAYNDKKIEKGDGELMKLNNFPSHIDENSSKEEIKEYFKTLSNSNSKVKNPQFHVAISCKAQEYSKEELSEIGEKFMNEMGYGEQPYIVVFHDDTKNNHIHIVSPRVDKTTGKKINDSYEKTKAQISIRKILNINYKNSIEKSIKDYKFANFNQLKLILERDGYKVEEKENDLIILKNGVKEYEIPLKDINYFSNKNNSKIYNERKSQIKAILNKYKKEFSNKVFQVRDDRMLNKFLNEKSDNKIKYSSESELQFQMKKMFGLDICFHQSENKMPYGFTIIDNKTGYVFKGSEIENMKNLFEFTNDVLDKNTFEDIKLFNVSNDDKKNILLKFYQNRGVNLKDFMIFFNKESKNEKFKNIIKADTIKFLEHKKNSNFNSIIENNKGDYYFVNLKYHSITFSEDIADRNKLDNYFENINNLPTTVNDNNDKTLLEVGEEILKDILKDEPASAEKEPRRKKKYIDDSYTR